MLYIIGCPRSGTHYIAKYLQLMGCRIGHEEIDKDGGVCWLWGSRNDLKGTIIHQVRHPTKCISSIAHLIPKLHSNSRRALNKLVPFNINTHPLIMGMHMYLYWNKICESKSIWTQRIEDFSHSKLKEYLIKAKIKFNDVIPVVPKANWSISYHTKHNWGMLYKLDMKLAEQVKELAIHYGYKI